MILYKGCFFHLRRLLNGRTTLHKHTDSALYLTGDKASKVVSILTPYVDTQFKDIENLQRNILLRRMKVNVVELSKQWQVLQDLISDKLFLEEKRIKIAEKMSSLKKAGPASEIEKCRIQGKVLRDDLKTLMKTLWSLEESVMLQTLSLPNDLHPATPDAQVNVIYEFKEIPREHNTDNHLNIAKRLSLIEYIDRTQYYFKGAAAVYESLLIHFFANEFLRSGFCSFSNPDFTRSVIVEGVGADHHDPDKIFCLKELTDSSSSHNREHLVGGASLFSFSAFHAKHVTEFDHLPIKYFALGNQYSPNNHHFPALGLFGAWQSAVVEVFLGVPDCFDAMMTEFDNTLNLLTKLYSQLGYHFRIVYMPAMELKPWESLRASIQLFSSHSQSYIEVGHLSTCDTFISKRLLMYYKPEDSGEHKFLRIISGTAVSVPKLLACVLECDQLLSTKGLQIPCAVRSDLFPTT